jgi:threonine dehydrogenase-like Zn-dependent dehydrogenase
MDSPGDVRVVNRDDPKIIEPTDAIIKLSATCICGSDLWRPRTPMFLPRHATHSLAAGTPEGRRDPSSTR